MVFIEGTRYFLKKEFVGPLTVGEYVVTFGCDTLIVGCDIVTVGCETSVHSGSVSRRVLT